MESLSERSWSLDRAREEIGRLRVLVEASKLINSSIDANALFADGATIPRIAGGVVLIFITAGSIHGLYQHSRVKSGEQKRGVYLLTDRRLIVLKGKTGGITFQNGNQNATNFDPDTRKQIEKARKSLFEFEAVDLLGMHRRLNPKFPGCGELLFERNVFDASAGLGLSAIDDVETVERLIREELIHPAIDRLLRGEISAYDFRPKSTGNESLPNAHVEDQRSNLGQTTAETETLADLKMELRKDLNAASVDEIECAERELTDGEELMWIGRPEVKMMRKGILGMLKRKPDNREPHYLMYAITNRRVLLWADKSSQGKNLRNGKNPVGPASYYSTMLQNIRSEPDDRLEDGGNLFFRVVNLTIVSKTTTRDTRGNMQTTSSTRIQFHRFGILRIHNFHEVGEAIFQFLVRPLRRR